jgi:hypothetical protein
MKQDFAQILTTAVLELRRAWKIYSNLQKYLFILFKKLEPNAEEIYGTTENIFLSEDLAEDDDDGDGEIIKNNNSELSLNSVRALLSAVSFGFGIIQLSFSFLQPNIIKLLKFIGFEVDRKAALTAIFYTSNSKDMRSPFADMIILMYSTVYIQMCGTYEKDMHLSYKDIQTILERNLTKNSNSCLFLLYKAKTELMNKNLDKSLEIYSMTLQFTSNIRELETITEYERGLIFLLNLDYSLAHDCFIKFTKNSKWSSVFNVYLIILLNGCLENFKKVDEMLNLKLKLSTRKNLIEIYALKRIDYLKKLTNKPASVYKFFCLELTYLWCYIPYAKLENLIKMLDGKFFI